MKDLRKIEELGMYIALLLIFIIEILYQTIPTLNNLFPTGWELGVIIVLIFFIIRLNSRVNKSIDKSIFAFLLDDIHETYSVAELMIKNAKVSVWSTFLTSTLPKHKKVEDYYDSTLKLQVKDFKRITTIDSKEKKNWFINHYKKGLAINPAFQLRYLKGSSRLIDILIVDNSDALIVLPNSDNNESGFWIKDKKVIEEIKLCYLYIWDQAEPITGIVNEKEHSGDH